MSAELSDIDAWIYTTLTGDSALMAAAPAGVHAEVAPQGTRGTLVTFGFLGGADRPLGTVRVSYALYLIRAIAESMSFAAVTAAADRIDALMTVPLAGAVAGDVRIYSVMRDQPHKRLDNSEGVPVVYLGGIYRIRTQPA